MPKGIYPRKITVWTIKGNLAYTDFSVGRCTIDLEDLDKVEGYYWGLYKTKRHKTSYVICQKDYKTTRLHRLIMDAPKNKEVDHKDRNGLNNCKSNLRFCSRSENNFNQGVRKNSTTKLIGIIFKKQNKIKKWLAQIRKDYKSYCKLFKTKKEAIKWRNKMVVLLYGDFAVLNET